MTEKMTKDREKALKKKGRITDEKCPECGGVILYNGNYFCEHFQSVEWGEKATFECSWALPHPPMRYVDRVLSWRLTGEWETETQNGWRINVYRTYPGITGRVAKKYREYLDGLAPVSDDVWWKKKRAEEKKGMGK